RAGHVVADQVQDLAALPGDGDDLDPSVARRRLAVGQTQRLQAVHDAGDVRGVAAQPPGQRPHRYRLAHRLQRLRLRGVQPLPGCGGGEVLEVGGADGGYRV